MDPLGEDLDELQFKGRFEAAAEVRRGLKKAFSDYEQKKENVGR